MNFLKTFIDLSILGKIIIISIIILIALVITLIVVIIKNKTIKRQKTVPIKIDKEKHEKKEEVKDLNEVVNALVPKPRPKIPRPKDTNVYTYDIVESVEERNVIIDPNETILNEAKENLNDNNYTENIVIDEHNSKIMEDDSLTDFEKTQELQAIISYEQLKARKQKNNKIVEVEDNPVKEELAKKIDIIEDQSKVRPLYVEKTIYKKEQEQVENDNKDAINANKFLEDLKSFRKTLK